LSPEAALPLRQAVTVFIAFAFAYFFSALVRAVTATLAPVFSAEMGLAAGQLGLLAGAYFLGFAVMQLPLGSALDRWGPRRVSMALLAVAVAGCLAFAAARSLAHLMLARLLIGMGFAACLMAPLTGYRRWLSASAQLRANSWMLMMGSLGMLASTLPVQWLLPTLGWRGLFLGVAGFLLLALLLIGWRVPVDAVAPPAELSDGGGYRRVFTDPAFVRMAPAGFVVYGGLVAMQTLWIGPWLTHVGTQTATQAAQGLFLVNMSMLVAFAAWGAAMPRLIRRGWAGERLIAMSWPASAACMAAIVWQGVDAGAALWVLWCVCTSVVSLSQPAIGQAVPAALVGRALSAFNLVIFAGVFALQWGIGLAIDGLRAHGLAVTQAYRVAFAGYLLASVLAFLWLQLLHRRQRQDAVDASTPR
jgi:MFS family permease